jgi:hypothetical protein
MLIKDSNTACSHLANMLWIKDTVEDLKYYDNSPIVVPAILCGRIIIRDDEVATRDLEPN